MSRRLYTTLAANIVFPLHERLKGHSTLSVLRDLKAIEWLDPVALDALRIERLRGLLCGASVHVPYYRKLFQKLDFSPERVTSIDDLQRLPVLEKSDIRRNYADLKADDAAGTRTFSTTGSSGDPLRFEIGKLRVSHDVAAKWLATQWWGVDIGDREIVAWSSPIELNSQDRVRRMRDLLLRSRLLPAISLSEKRLGECVQEIRDFRPVMLFGYPSSLTLIAQYAAKHDVTMSDLGIEVAFVTAEKVYPHQRDWIGRVFGCRVAEGYGGRDSGFIAHECPNGGLHVNAGDIVVEIVDAGGHVLPHGQAGEVVVTHLFTHDFPFVRYRTGDVAVLDDRQCPCGRGLPLMREVQGRTNDFLLLPDGGRVHDVAFAMLLRDMPGVEQFKIIQESFELTRVELVTGTSFDAEHSIPKIEALFRARLGGSTRIEIGLVPVIHPESTGKYRYVVSKIASVPPSGSSEPAATNATSP